MTSPRRDSRTPAEDGNKFVFHIDLSRPSTDTVVGHGIQSLHRGRIERYDGSRGDAKPGSTDVGNGRVGMVFRAMREGPTGGPLVGPTARTLGVRPGDDIPVVGGRVGPGTGGLSVAPDVPSNLPDHRRPPRFGGTGKDSVWGIEADSLGGDVVFRRDKPAHGLLEPAKEMSIEEFQAALADLAPRWIKT